MKHKTIITAACATLLLTACGRGGDRHVTADGHAGEAKEHGHEIVISAKEAEARDRLSEVRSELQSLSRLDERLSDSSPLVARIMGELKDGVEGRLGDIIEVPEEFFGIFYMDCMDDMQKYDGKTVKFLAQVCQTSRAGKDSFVPGRFAMTCCVQDIQFVGFPCRYDAYKALKQRDWITVTARVNIKFHPIYKGQTPDSTGPVLTALSVEPAAKPANDVVMFS